MGKIVRTPNRAKGGITDDERVALKRVSEEWIGIAMRTDPIEPVKIVPAVEALYAAAGLKRPRVVIAPSPLVMAFAYGAATAIWHRRSDGLADAYDGTKIATADTATYDATDSATYAATYATTAATDATRAATTAATDAATRDATDAAYAAATYAATDAATHADTAVATYESTYVATYDATRDAIRVAADTATYDATLADTAAATYESTYAATEAATRDAIRVATRDAIRVATYGSGGKTAAAQACRKLAGDLGLKCASQWIRVYQGGNMWPAQTAYFAGMRDILGLRLPEFEKYQSWEDCARHGGFRVMHEEFCIVSDFPEIIRVDEQHRPHCENGPSHRWRDGWALYHWHGIRVPDHWIEDRDGTDPAEVLAAQNVELRAAGCAILGWARMAPRLGMQVIDGDPSTKEGALVQMQMPGLPEPELFLMAACPRNGTICEGVDRVSDITGKPITTALEAQAWSLGLAPEEYSTPTLRT